MADAHETPAASDHDEALELLERRYVAVLPRPIAADVDVKHDAQREEDDGEVEHVRPAAQEEGTQCGQQQQQLAREDDQDAERAERQLVVHLVRPLVVEALKAVGSRRGDEGRRALRPQVASHTRQ